MKNNTETRVALLEQSIGHITEVLVRLENKIDSGFKDVNKRIDKIDDRMDKMESRIWSNFMWQLSTTLGLAFTGLGVIAKGFGWL